MKILRKLSLTFLVVALSATSLLAGGCAKVNSNKTVPEFTSNYQFKIFADRPPTPNNEHLTVYQDAGFTHYVMTEDDYAFTNDQGQITDKYATALNICDDLGLKVIIRNYRDDPDYFVNEVGRNKTNKDYLGNYITYYLPKRNITTQLSEFAAVDGYYMADEPMYSKISGLTKLADWYNAYGGNTYFHINLTGSVLGSGLMERHSYTEYVGHYADTVLAKVKGPKSLSVDFYPLMEGDNGDRYLQKEILSDYMVIANKVKSMNQTLTGNDKVLANYCIQTFYSKTDWGWRDLVGESDVTFQTYLAAAFGGKSFEYYMYRGMNEDTAIVEAISQKPRAMYYWVQSANKEMQALAPVILPFEWNGVKGFKGSQVSDKTNQEAFDLIKEQQLKDFTFISDVYCRLDTLVSEHMDNKGN